MSSHLIRASLFLIFFSMPAIAEREVVKTEVLELSEDGVGQIDYVFTIHTKSGRKKKEWIIPVYKAQTFRIPKNVAPDLRPINPIQPLYPSEAAKNGIEGFVCFLFDLDAEGAVTNPRVYDLRPRHVFEIASAEAIMKWRFAPATESEKQEMRKNLKYCFSFEMEN